MGVNVRPVRIRARMCDGTEPEVDAYPTPVPGLYVSADPQVPGSWAVVLPLGIAVGAGFDSPEAAASAAPTDLGPVADWAMPVDKDAINDQVLAIITRWGAADGPVLPEETARAAGAIT